MPIDTKERFSLLPHIFAGDLLMFPFIDYDRRQYLNLTIWPDALPPINPEDPDSNTRIRHYWDHCVSTFLPRICNFLDLDVGAFTVDPNTNGGELISSSSDPEECSAYSFSYPTPIELGLSYNVKTIKRFELVEVERLDRCTDLVSFRDDGSDEVDLAIFKYYFSSEGVVKTIHDIQALSQLQNHPNIAHLTHLVLDDTGQVVVGFLLKNYLPTKPIFNRATPASSFKLSGLSHLIELIDSLNLTYGLVGEGFWFTNMYWAIKFDELVLDSLVLSRPITPENTLRDVYLSVVAIYEEITHEYSHTDLSNLSHANAKVRATQILGMRDGDWPQPPDVRLEGGDIEDFRRTLQDWVFQRKWVHFPVRHGTSREQQRDVSDEAEDSGVGEKRKEAVEYVQSNKRPRRLQDELDEAYLPASEKKIALKEVKKVIDGKEYLLWDPKTWKRDANLPQPVDNPVVNWLRAPESKMERRGPNLGKTALVVGSKDDGEGEEEHDEYDGILIAAREILAARATARAEKEQEEEEKGYESDDEGANVDANLEAEEEPGQFPQSE